MLQGKRDVDTVLTMGIMEDVSIIPQPAGGKMIQLFIYYSLMLVNVHYRYTSVCMPIRILFLEIHFLQILVRLILQ